MDGPANAQEQMPLPVVFPVMTKEKFAEFSGLTRGVIQGMIEKGHLPSVKIGRHRLVNVALLAMECTGREARHADDGSFSH
jgi:excisionase family DNA binding protein